KKDSKKAAEVFTAEGLAGLARARELRPGVISGATPLVTYNQLLTSASATNALAGLMSEVHPDEAIRDAARECEQEVSRFYSDLALDREVYEALASVDVADADP